MTPIEPATPPRKASWKRWVIAAAGVAAIALAVFFSKAPKNDPVTVTFLRSTNENGVKKLVFVVTNRLPRLVLYGAEVVVTRTTATDGKVPPYVVGKTVFEGLEIGEAKTFSLEAARPGTDWHVSWIFIDEYRPRTWWRETKRDLASKFTQHGMHHLGDQVNPDFHKRTISSTEIKE